MASARVILTIFAVLAAGASAEASGGAAAAAAAAAAANTKVAPKEAPKEKSMDDYRKDKAEEAAAAKVATGKQAKMAAVDKVLELMATLKTKVVVEGQAEAVVYAEVCRQCDTIKKVKSQDISEEKTEVTRLSTEIKKSGQDKKSLEQQISGIVESLKEAAEAKVSAKSTHVKKADEYGTNKADMSAAISSLADAIKKMKAGTNMGIGLLQIQAVSKTVTDALLLADALGLGSAPQAASLLQDGVDGTPEVEMDNYKFKSTAVTDVLENLLTEFRAQKVTLDENEVKRVSDFRKLIQEKTDEEKALTHDMENVKKVKRAEKINLMATDTDLRVGESGQLSDDKSFLDVTVESCEQKKNTFKQRSATRLSELTALTQATAIIKSTVVEKTKAATVRLAQTGVSIHLAGAAGSSESAMEAIEAEAEFADEDSAPAFIQTASTQKKHFLQKVKQHSPDVARDMVISLFNANGKKLHSAALMAVAAQISAESSADPLAKVKTLISELVERLLSEAANEANQKGWCDKAQGDSQQKREYAADAVKYLKGEEEKHQALSDLLGEELEKIGTSIRELNDVAGETKAERTTDKKENAETIADAEQGAKAVDEANTILSRFYGTARNTAADATSGEDQVQDTYAGSADEAGGIVAMLEVIAGDFRRTVKQTNADEIKSNALFIKFMTSTMVSLAEKDQVKKAKNKLKGETDEALEVDKEELESKEKVLATAKKELKELDTACQPKGQTSEERVSKRQDELASLKRGLCILTAMADGEAADEC